MTTLADKISTYTSNAELSNLLAGNRFGLYSAKSYGAEGDGATDDSEAILSLISAVSASTSKSMFFPAGVYVVDNVTLTSTHFDGYYLIGDNASFSGITQHIEQFGNTVGDLSGLVTSATSSIVAAINEVSAASASVLTTRGDILIRDSTGSIRFATGSPLQYVVAGNTSDTTPFNYQDSPQKVMTAMGDMLKSTGPNTINRLAGSTGAGVLAYQLSSSSPGWVEGTNLQYPVIDATTDKVEFQDSPQKVLTTLGDLMYASAANTIQRLGIGSTGQVLGISTGGIPAWQSSTALSISGSFGKQVFTASSTFTAPLSGTYKVTVVGGGGSRASDAGSGPSFLGGGGGGGVSVEFVTLTKDDTVLVTVGAGGTDPNSAASNGNAGQTSSFGAYLSATGGSGGTYSASNVGAGGAGGNGVGGDVNMYGGTGGWAAQVAATNTEFNHLTSHFEQYGSGSPASFGTNGSSGFDGVVIVEWVGV